VFSTDPDSGKALGKAAMVATLGVAVAVGLGVAVALVVAAAPPMAGVAVGWGVALAVAAEPPIAAQVTELGFAGLRHELLIQESPREQSLSVRQAASQDTDVLGALTLAVVVALGVAVGTAANAGPTVNV